MRLMTNTEFVTRDLMAIPEYRSWVSMRQRCRNPRSQAYPRYGGRGITICERWDSFDNFLADMGPRPRGTSLDRIDGNKGYELTNCRWATRAEQNLNRSNTRWITHNGRTMCMREWADTLGISPGHLFSRLTNRWPLHLALTQRHSSF